MIVNLQVVGAQSTRTHGEYKRSAIFGCKLRSIQQRESEEREMKFSPLIQLMILLLMLSEAIIGGAAMTPDCRKTCGNVTIPYPFGIGRNCARPFFDLTCNDTDYKSPKTFLTTSSIEITAIDLQGGQIILNMYRSFACYDKPRLYGSHMAWSFLGNSSYPYVFSGVANTFVAIGCDTIAYIVSSSSSDFANGCVTTCSRKNSVVDGPCSGAGCCQIPVPPGLKYFELQLRSFNNHSKVLDFNPCSYALLVDRKWFSFHASDIGYDSMYNSQYKEVPVVLDWSVANLTCEEAKMDMATYACVSKNSFCYNSNSSAPGYLCSCSPGYDGNPYENNGCRDIDECHNPKKYPCQGICKNIPGDYECTCQPGFHGNAKTMTCIQDPLVWRVKDGLPQQAKWAIGAASGAVFLLFVIFGLYWGYKKLVMIHLRQKFFELNGGIFLKRQIASHRATAFNIFTLSQLQKATHNFSRETLLGEGGNACVHKGQLKDGRVVAIKKEKDSKDATANRNKKEVEFEKKRQEFAGEMLILAGINHKNVVKLLGCCMEVEIPMLVYEYIQNNTLSRYIHDNTLPLRFSDCLRIMIETAKALAYLHHEVEPGIIHGDIKPQNILLDGNHMVKIADFGTSIFAEKCELKETGPVWVKGTFGYWDPEYMQMGELTCKSDVYSFGIVMMELLSRKREVSRLGGDFQSFLNENNLAGIVNPCYLNHGNVTKELAEVSKIAIKCVSLEGDARPSMVEVVLALETIRMSAMPNELPEQQEPFIRLEPNGGSSIDATFSFALEIEKSPLVAMGNSGR